MLRGSEHRPAEETGSPRSRWLVWLDGDKFSPRRSVRPDSLLSICRHDVQSASWQRASAQSEQVEEWKKQTAAPAQATGIGLPTTASRVIVQTTDEIILGVKSSQTRLWSVFNRHPRLATHTAAHSARFSRGVSQLCEMSKREILVTLF